MRIALVRGFGSPGTFAWEPKRLAVRTRTEGICITDQAALKAGYMLSHHNCSDLLRVSSGDRQVEVAPPDTLLPVRKISVVKVSAGGTDLVGPVALDVLSCTTNSGAVCTSGGPCPR
jgi:hypothetical protein